jgi:hypothetical protein
MMKWAAEPEKVDDCIPPWVAGRHHKNFFRIALHLWWRAALLGEFVKLDNLCGSLSYDLSAEFLYWSALASEPVRMKHWSFDQILATPPPELFDQFWRADLKRWMRNNPTWQEEAA